MSHSAHAARVSSTFRPPSAATTRAGQRGWGPCQSRPGATTCLRVGDVGHDGRSFAHCRRIATKDLPCYLGLRVARVCHWAPVHRGGAPGCLNTGGDPVESVALYSGCGGLSTRTVTPFLGGRLAELRGEFLKSEVEHVDPSMQTPWQRHPG